MNIYAHFQEGLNDHNSNIDDNNKVALAHIILTKIPYNIFLLS